MPSRRRAPVSGRLAIQRRAACLRRRPTNVSADELAKMKGGVEAPDAADLTTVKEYAYVPGSKLPDVKGTSAYTPMADNTVRMALNVWAGWAPVIYANNGFKPAKIWKAPGGKTFKLELVLIDDPIAMRDAYASGKVHIGWATLDMIPLFVEQLARDSRTMAARLPACGLVERRRRHPSAAATCGPSATTGKRSCSPRTRRPLLPSQHADQRGVQPTK